MEDKLVEHLFVEKAKNYLGWLQKEGIIEQEDLEVIESLKENGWSVSLALYVLINVPENYDLEYPIKLVPVDNDNSDTVIDFYVTEIGDVFVGLDIENGEWYTFPVEKKTIQCEKFVRADNNKH